MTSNSHDAPPPFSHDAPLDDFCIEGLQDKTISVSESISHDAPLDDFCIEGLQDKTISVSESISHDAPLDARSAAPTTKEAGTAGSMEKDEVIELMEDLLD
eukprot:SAG31_NODE_10111_length_1181_cov_1.161738_2_plen_101_part_00